MPYPKPVPRMLITLCHRRWALPLLAALSARGGARFVELQRGVGVSAQPLRDNLDALIDAGWLARHGGHGHPLRPEYVLTPAGKPVAAAAAVILSVAEPAGQVDVLTRKWTLPLISALAAGEARFAALAAALGGVNPRALTLALKQLVAAGLISRHVSAGHPPAVSYALERRAEALRPGLRALLRALAL